MNILSNMEEVANVIIRPSRYYYKITDLGSKVITIDDRKVLRNDFDVKNKRGHLLKASLFTTHQQLENIRNVMIYLHCNSGCRIQGLAYLNYAIKSNFSYVLFDFSGSGNSEGKYISLGFYEVDDLTAIIEYLKQRISPWINIGLWGRSMGAVTALRYLSLNPKNNNIKVGVFDSPFESLKQLFIQIGKQKTNLPKIVLEIAYKYLKPIIQQKAQFNIDEVDLNFTMNDLVKVPGIFIASKNDSLIPFKQIDRIFTRYSGNRQMFFIDESHNESRNTGVIKNVFENAEKFFIQSPIVQDFKFNYYSFAAVKKVCQPLPKQKLELTIKSFSQKVLLTNQIQTSLSKKNLSKQVSHSHMEKRQMSSGVFARKASAKLGGQSKQKTELFQANRASLQTRRNPINIKRFFKDQKETQQQKNNENRQQIKFRPKIQWEKGCLFVDSSAKAQRQKDHKNIQKMQKKRPPFNQLKHSNDLRGSFETKTKKKQAQNGNYLPKQKIRQL